MQVTAFLHPDTVGRAAYACIHFLELLVGPGCQKLTVSSIGWAYTHLFQGRGSGHPFTDTCSLGHITACPHELPCQ